MEREAQTTELTALVSLAKAGHSPAVEQLVETYAPRLYGLLYRMTGSTADAEDLLQETFVKMLRGLVIYQEDGRFEPWLFSIAANLARDWLRRKNRPAAAATADAAELANATADDPGPEMPLIRAEECDRLQRALRELSPNEREMVVLRFFSDLPFKEIAAALKIPLGTALARAHRALKHLRQRLQDEPMTDKVRRTR